MSSFADCVGSSFWVRWSLGLFLSQRYTQVCFSEGEFLKGSPGPCVESLTNLLRRAKFACVYGWMFLVLVVLFVSVDRLDGCLQFFLLMKKITLFRLLVRENDFILFRGNARPHVLCV